MRMLGLFGSFRLQHYPDMAYMECNATSFELSNSLMALGKALFIHLTNLYQLSKVIFFDDFNNAREFTMSNHFKPT